MDIKWIFFNEFFQWMLPLIPPGGEEGPALRDTLYRLVGFAPPEELGPVGGYPVRDNGTHLFRMVRYVSIYILGNYKFFNIYSKIKKDNVINYAY